MKQEQTCKNWFMHKRGKQWIYGCSVLAVTIMIATSMQVISADEIEQTEKLVTVEKSNAEPIIIERTSETTASEVPSKDTTTPTETSTETTEPVASQETQEEVTVEKETIPTVKDDEATVAKIEEKTSTEPKEVQKTSENFKTNLSNTTVSNNGTWEVRSEGLYSNAVEQGDSFLYSKTEGNNFVYSTDVTFLQDKGAAALVFRSDNNPDNKNSYAVNLDASSNKVKFWRWDGNQDYQLIDEKQIAATNNKKYQLKVVAIGSWISYYVNDVLVASTGDYTLQREDKGQRTYLDKGYFGLLNWNGEMIFQNTHYTAIDDNNTPLLKDITVTSPVGTVEKKGQFVPTEPITIQYVKNDASKIDLSIASQSDKAKIKVQDAEGNVYDDFKNIPLKVGANYLAITSQVTTDDGEVATVTYRINVHRRQADEVYYNELHRNQYHYSVKDGWANDPNGLVYYNGVYHLFYQFYDDKKWGPMHWAHATSTDLLTWEEQPIALYPDANGTMFSGCIVVDNQNTSGLFPKGTGGLVALITADGNGQRIKLAYSTDEGKTWMKSDKVVADWKDDPLQSQDFRDPKVFRWEDKWFMVIAGGPMRIYSSTNLLDWTVESTYADLHTECPDLYPLQTAEGTLKWVLSRGGRHYKVGDFKQVDGKWTFVADEGYQTTDTMMNFGKDSYAAMTYYVQDFGSSAHPTIPEIVELNWMNTWEDYCNLVAERVGQNFNGTFNLNLKLGLVSDNGRYVLIQKPIEAYKNLRDTENAMTFKDVEIAPNNNLLSGFKGDTYEIVSTFRPSEKTKKIGFNLRVGDGEVTKVIYNLETEKLSIDRSQSGVILTDQFAAINSQAATRNADGSIDLHLYVDKSSVEVFAKNYTVAGANQIFTSPTSLGLSTLVEGGSTKADIAIYPMKTIWKNKLTVTKPLEVVQASATTNNLYVGDTTELKAYVMPAEASQEVVWTVSQPDIVALKGTGNKVSVTALKKGSVTIYATSKENPSLMKSFTVNILENNFQTNIKDLTALAGNWYIDDKSLLDSNTSSNDYYMTKNKVEFSEYALDLDLKYKKGLMNIFFASENSQPAFSYAIQFGANNVIRLYRFFGDTIAEANMNKPINDDAFHHVKIVKTKTAVSVLVDGVEYLKHDFDYVEDFYNHAHVGLGLWDGALEVQNFFITNLNEEKSPKVLNEKKEIIDPKTGVRVTLDKGELATITDIGVEHIETNHINTPSVLKKKDYDLFDIVLKNKEGQKLANQKDVLVILPIDLGKEVDKVFYLPNSDQEEDLKFIQTTILDANGNRMNAVSFVAKHFSQYGIVYKISATKEDNTNTTNSRDNQKTTTIPDSSQMKETVLSTARHQTNSAVGKSENKIMSTNQLPETGENRSYLTIGLGLLAFLSSISLIFRKNTRKQ